MPVKIKVCLDRGTPYDSPVYVERVLPQEKWRPVLTKQDFVRRYAEGEFGNASPTWNGLKEWLDEPNELIDPDGLYHVRNRIAGGKTWYDVPYAFVPRIWKTAIKQEGLLENQLYISSMAPTAKTTLQGEVQQGPRGLELFYSTVALPMRDALKKESFQVYGLRAVSLLKKYLCVNSYEWLQILLDRYSEHVIEFSCYSCEWGTIPGYNTCYWEVRKY